MNVKSLLVTKKKGWELVVSFENKSLNFFRWEVSIISIIIIKFLAWKLEIQSFKTNDLWGLKKTLETLTELID